MSLQGTERLREIAEKRRNRRGMYAFGYPPGTTKDAQKRTANSRRKRRSRAASDEGGAEK